MSRFWDMGSHDRPGSPKLSATTKTARKPRAFSHSTKLNRKPSPFSPANKLNPEGGSTSTMPINSTGRGTALNHANQLNPEGQGFSPANKRRAEGATALPKARLSSFAFVVAFAFCCCRSPLPLPLLLLPPTLSKTNKPEGPCNSKCHNSVRPTAFQVIPSMRLKDA